MSGSKYLWEEFDFDINIRGGTKASLLRKNSAGCCMCINRNYIVNINSAQFPEGLAIDSVGFPLFVLSVGSDFFSCLPD